MKKNKQKKVRKNNGFTLIELLAVIIILGILMIIAIPSVTSYISNSRKSAYVNTAKEIVAGARNLVNEGNLEMFDTNTTYYLPSSCISTENSQKSPYGDFDKAYVLVTYNGKGYNYYWVSRDTTGQGVKDPIPSSVLSEDDIVSDIASNYITTNVTVEGKGNIQLLSNSDCKSFSSQPVVANISNAVCRRATELHTNPCNIDRNDWGCKRNSSTSTSVTYGNLGTSGTLTSGDAFDCDVNNDGTYDSETERFYYVTSNGNNAVLIYYSNVSSNGEPSYLSSNEEYEIYRNDNIGDIEVKFLSYDESYGDEYGYGNVSEPTAMYDESNENWHGPVTAMEQLPSTTQWSNPKLIAPGTRQIKNEIGTIYTDLGRYDGGPFTIKNFTYTNKSSRLLTIQEIYQACNLTDNNINNSDELDNCNYLMEGIMDGKYNNYNNEYWLETPHSDVGDSVWLVTGLGKRLEDWGAASVGVGVRPVIEVLKSDMQY